MFDIVEVTDTEVLFRYRGVDMAAVLKAYHKLPDGVVRGSAYGVDVGVSFSDYVALEAAIDEWLRYTGKKSY